MEIWRAGIFTTNRRKRSGKGQKTESSKNTGTSYAYRFDSFCEFHSYNYWKQVAYEVGMGETSAPLSTAYSSVYWS